MNQADRSKRWAVALCSARPEVAPIELVAAVANRAAEALGVDPVAPAHPGDLELIPAEVGDEVGEPPGGWADPWVVGAVHEHAASGEDRKHRGAWYTPRSVVEGLVAMATADEIAPRFIVDLTCGGGAFLLAALDRLVALGVEPLDAVGRVGGMDLDADAVAVSRWSLALWLQRHLVAAGAPTEDRAAARAVTIDVRQGDALTPLPPEWVSPPESVLVVGNPPFASPLKKGAIPERAAEFRLERSELLGPYADLATIHLLHTVEQLGSGSTVVLVQPQSTLSSRDTESLRAHLAQAAPMSGLWAAREAIFDAGVRACAPILRVGDAGVGVAPGGPAGSAVMLAAGPTVAEQGRRPRGRWSDLAAEALGAPSMPGVSARRLRERVSATAGFRDEHYGLVAACREGRDDDGPDVGRVATVGSVDPLTVGWGRRRYRFGGSDWDRPVVDRGSLSGKVQQWYDRQSRPKVLLATQTKLLEPVVDRAGDLVPATPLIAVHADPADLDRVAAVLLAPPVVLWAWRHWFGSALSVDAVKLAARQVGELPLPVDDGAWAEGASIVATADGAEPAQAWDLAVAVAEVMTVAYGASDEVLEWWKRRLKARPGPVE